MPTSAVRGVVRAVREGGLSNVCTRTCARFTRTRPFATAKLRHVRRRLSPAPTFHPFAVYDVDPRVLDRYVPFETFRTFENAGRVLAGPWDAAAEPLASFDKRSVIRRYLEGDIDADSLTREFLRSNGYPDGEARAYVAYGYAAYLDELSESIAENGVRLHPARSADRPAARYDHIAVDIAGTGNCSSTKTAVID